MQTTWDHVTHTIANHKKALLIILLVWGIWAFGIGFIGGLFSSRGGLDKFPDIVREDRILILAPHIDDETIGTGGIIQRAISLGAQVKVVYMTNGDNSTSSVIGNEKKINTTPEEYISLGETRMEEGKKATAILGLKEKDLVFLGFPDNGLKPMLGKNYNSLIPYTSNGTKFNHSPYRETYKIGEIYSGENMVTDLQEIIASFKPTIIFVSHPRDEHPDHQATYQFLERSLGENRAKIFAYLVHFPFYPPQKKLREQSFIYPPTKLFSKIGWDSFQLTEQEIKNKKLAIDENKSQLKLSSVYNFLRSFVKRNELFELQN